MVSRGAVESRSLGMSCTARQRETRVPEVQKYAFPICIRAKVVREVGDGSFASVKNIDAQPNNSAHRGLLA